MEWWHWALLFVSLVIAFIFWFVAKQKASQAETTSTQPINCNEITQELQAKLKGLEDARKQWVNDKALQQQFQGKRDEELRVANANLKSTETNLQALQDQKRQWIEEQQLQGKRDEELRVANRELQTLKDEKKKWVNDKSEMAMRNQRQGNINEQLRVANGALKNEQQQNQQKRTWFLQAIQKEQALSKTTKKMLQEDIEQLEKQVVETGKLKDELDAANARLTTCNDHLKRCAEALNR